MSATLFANIAVTLAVHWVQVETVKTGFCHESIREHQVLVGKKTRSYWWKKAPHQSVTKVYGKPHDLVAEEHGKLWEGRRRKSDSSSDVVETAKFVTHSVF